MGPDQSPSEALMGLADVHPSVRPTAPHRFAIEVQAAIGYGQCMHRAPTVLVIII